MSQSQRLSLRRSARHAFDDEDIPFPAAKRSKSSKVEAEGAKGKNEAQGTTATAAAKKGVRKKANIGYDENDDGFQFSRTRSKSAKAPAPTQDSVTTTAAKALPARRKRNSLAPEPVEKERDTGRRRSKRLSGEKISTPRVPKSKAQQPNGDARRPPSPANEEPIAKSKQQTADKRSDSPSAQHSPLTIAKKRDGTKIALPFADTPVIKRNKELRKTGHRRSSSGMRGRRASSLIESGSNGGHNFHDTPSDKHSPEELAIHDARPDQIAGLAEDHISENTADFVTHLAVPHTEVEVDDFYKLIEQSLPEPRRMKQLLTWCGTRALPAKSGAKSKDATEVVAVETARHIQEELLKDFAGKAELSDWFSREDDAPATVLVKNPNPRNVQNTARLQQLELEIRRLQDEKRAWDTLLSNPLLPPPSTTTAPPSTSSTSHINPDLLDDPTQSSILALLKSSSSAVPPPQSLLPRPTAPAKRGMPADALNPPTQRDETQQRLRALAAALEPTVDNFAHGVHRLAQYRLAADRVADRVLADGARVLEERDRAVREASGTVGIGGLDALRALGGVLGRQ